MLKHQLSTERLPTYAISHGGGPWPWIKDLTPVDWDPLESALSAIPGELPIRPRAVLMISAHWETTGFRVQTSAAPRMVYDYGGFPDFTYEIQYGAPGAPDVAARTIDLLQSGGFDASPDPDRGFDHGVFAPMRVMYPDADMPTVQLSIDRGFDPATHLAVGRALEPLRDEGVLIVGSGFPSFHDLANLGGISAEPSRRFDTWLTESMIDHRGEARHSRLVDWASAPSARQAHPREDHLVPLFVAVGAAETDVAVRHYHEDDAMGGWLTTSGYRLG